MRVLGLYPHLNAGLERAPEVKRYFPWGFATVLRRLEMAGHRVEVIDAYGDDLVRTEVADRLAGTVFDCACVSGFASYNFPYVVWLAGEIKRRRDVPVVVGGLVAELHHDLLLRSGLVDVCVLGEAEDSAVELLANLDAPGRVSGVAFRRGGEAVVTGGPRTVRDLDALPMPSFEQWNMERYTRGDNLWVHDPSTRAESFTYLAHLDPAKLVPNMSVFAGRGCPFRCTFCSRSSDAYRFKSVDRIARELAELRARFGVNAFHFYDELLVVDRRRTLELCERIGPMGVYWDCQARVNTVDRELLSAMRQANCLSIGLGLESGSNELLRAMRKGITREQSARALEEARKAGMHLKLQFMFGYPGETEQTLRETLSLVAGTGIPPRRLLWCTPLPGSELYDDAKAKGLIPDEAEYLGKLATHSMNQPEALVLNVSGIEDHRAVVLFYWVHLRMERDFLLHALTHAALWSAAVRGSLARSLGLLKSYLRATLEWREHSGRGLTWPLLVARGLARLARRLLGRDTA